MSMELEWRVRLFGAKGELRSWIAKNEPSLIWREDGKVLAQWKNNWGLVTVLVSGHHSLSFAPVEKEPEPVAK